MSAREAMRAGLLTALGTALRPLSVAVFDAPPVRGGVPQVVLGEPLESDWGAAGVEGRELRWPATLTDEGERPVRLRAVVAAAEAVRLPAMLADGWRVAGLVATTTRFVRGAGPRWAVTIEWRARLWRAAQ
ncbi:DUF3168 domain-containing protein [Sphingomonadaceae bacterium jetA1]|uniref:tail completion protein gp17 n=1 Tax=Facivitalis istanbulensis TaxID=3075838 RepID=UPI00346B3F39